MTDTNRNSKLYKELVGKMPKFDDLVNEEIDGEVFHYLPEQRCKICVADSKGLRNGVAVKNMVDMLLLYPKSYSETLRFIQPLMEDWPEKDRINYSSVRTHQQRHLPFDKIAIREIIERRAKENGLAILEGAHRMMTAETFFETIAQRTWDKLVEGVLSPTLKEGMEAMQRLRELEEAAGTEHSVAEMLTELEFIIQAVNSIVPVEMKEEIQEFIHRAKKGELPSASSVEIVDGEVVEEKLSEEERFSQLEKEAKENE